KSRVPDNDIARKICLDYTMAGARKITSICAATTAAAGLKHKFRFVYLSGAAAERNQTKQLWFMRDYRRIRGEAENGLLAHAETNRDAFEICIMRPGTVLGKEMGLLNMVKGLGPSVKVDKLAGAMVRIALDGVGKQIIEKSEIRV
ncbi:MAG: hypothetical protein Q9204_009095, partial [Flavoplaca sp. TL-2023a]